MFKCHACDRQFYAGFRRNPQTIFEEYFHGKQTYAQLAEKYGCSPKTIQRCIDKASATKENSVLPAASILIDTTYFGRKYGVMVFKDAISGTILLTKFVTHETVSEYKAGVDESSPTELPCRRLSAMGKRVSSIPLPISRYRFASLIR